MLDIPGPSGPLRGEIIKAAPGTAAVIIIPGSGPTDRNGNGPLLMTNGYKLLAEGLAKEGISSLRIDKRGIGESRTALSPSEAEDITIDDYVRDVSVWQRKLTQLTGHHCVWYVGHSEGGLISLLAATKKSIPKPCGLVLIATAGRNIDEVLLDQMEENPANEPYMAELKAILDSLKHGQQVPTTSISPPLLPLFHKDAQSLLISELAYSVVDLARDVKEPTLIIQGDKDIQVKTADARLLNEALPKSKSVIINGMTHTLKDDQPGFPLITYQDPHMPLSAPLVQTIAQFIKAHTAN